MSTWGEFRASHGAKYDLGHLRHELDKSRVLFEPKSAATPLPEAPGWRSPVSGLQSVSPSTWQATVALKPAEPQAVDTSAMATDCGKMEAVFGQSIDWEKVANILAAKLEKAELDSAGLKNERDLMQTQLGRLEQIAEAHANAALEAATARQTAQVNQRNCDAQTDQTGDAALSLAAELETCQKHNTRLRSGLDLQEQEITLLKQQQVEQESILEQLSIQVAQQEAQLAQASAARRQLNTELAQNQSVILNLKQKTKTLKRNLRMSGATSRDLRQSEPSTQTEFVDDGDDGGDNAEPIPVPALGSTGFGSG
eukprot:TRINITY_DN7911_c0_g1_i1.p1 TRINITY_DN7911_c0_g1~~TRINITY_DN7911_c0_g1_i1.p1  ORF type:complete len:311 (-),score=80.34 TRINITY_DN7911_c0_g1_i1:43-975(-)